MNDDCAPNTGRNCKIKVLLTEEQKAKKRERERERYRNLNDQEKAAYLLKTKKRHEAMPQEQRREKRTKYKSRKALLSRLKRQAETPEERAERCRKVREYLEARNGLGAPRKRKPYKPRQSPPERKPRLYPDKMPVECTRFARSLRTRIGFLLKRIDGKKGSPTVKLLGCSFEMFKKHLERRFAKGMTWKNYGRNGWHIDHIVPCAAFDLRKREDQEKCFHFSNMRPMWANENRSKNGRIITCQPELMLSLASN